MANPTPTPGEYKRDVGSGDQLASGNATSTNQDLVAGDAVEEQIASAAVVADTMPGPVQYATEDPAPYQPRSDMEGVLFGPAEGLKPEPTSDKRPVPDSVIRALPGMSMIVNDPATPAAIKAAYRYLVLRLEAEMKARY
jgi:hypothetical protein